MKKRNNSTVLKWDDRERRILDTMKNHPLTYDDLVVRQILQSVIVESKQKIKVIFLGGLEVEAEMEQ